MQRVGAAGVVRREPVHGEDSSERGRDRHVAFRRLRLRLDKMAAPVKLPANPQRARLHVHVSPPEAERLTLPQARQHGHRNERPVLLRCLRDQPPDCLAVKLRELAALHLRPFALLQPPDRVRRDRPVPYRRGEHAAQHDQHASDRPGRKRLPCRLHDCPSRSM